tara:strand:+ start:826 stop:996 length:171 start_codon:yes stop_codon:yes gene_type:complete
MVDTYLQGDIDTAIEILMDLANGDYTVDNLKTGVEEACITRGDLEDISRYENFHRG